MGQRRQLNGCRVLITGASQGIGRALAAQAVQRGAHVLAAARSLDLLHEVANEAQAAGHTLHTVVGDVTKATDRIAMVDACTAKLGGLDLLINNAGIGATGPFNDADGDRLRQIFEVNVFGLAEMTRICLPLLRQGTKPAIANISSFVARYGLPGRSEYSASKAAVESLSQAWRAEFARFGIDVLLISPGLTQTNFPMNMIERKSKMPVDHMRGMTADECARHTLNAIERGRNTTTLTFQAKLYTQVARFVPWLVDRIAARRVRKLYGN